jgi:hypothetical protein
METLAFDQLPKAVSELLEKVSKIENILRGNSFTKLIIAITLKTTWKR